MSWARYRRAVEPTAEAVARVRARLEVDQAPAPVASLREVDPHAVARVRARLAAPRRTMGWAWAAVPVAALIVFAVLMRPAPALEGPLQPGEQAAGPDARVVATGDGDLGGTASAPRVEWRAGTLVVDVTPGRGVDFRVRTEEGEVRVVGTRFSVTRDRLGTRVEVERGHVAVSCVDGATAELLAGDTTTCLPVRAAGLLGRARALLDAGDREGALDAITRGLAAGPADAVVDELLTLRATTRYAEDPVAAVPALDAALARPANPRRVDLLRLRARAGGDCDGALPWLDAIPEAERTAADWVARADCLDGPAALDALDNAAAVTTDPAVTAAIAARRRVLDHR